MKTTKSILGLSLALTLAACGSVTPEAQQNTEKAWQSVYSNPSLAGMVQQQLPPREALLKDQDTQDSTNQVVVSYTAQTENAFEVMVRSLGATLTTRMVPARSSNRFAVLTLPGDLSASKVSRALSNTGLLRYAQSAQKHLMPRVPLAGTSGPLTSKPTLEKQSTASDPLVIKQWWLNNVKANQVRNIATGKGIIVGVVDTDFNRLHEDLKADGKIVTGIDAFTTTDFTKPNLLQPSDPLTDSTHGSGSAGTIAERMNNGVGGAGVAPDAILMPVRIGSEIWGFGYDFAIAFGMMWAVDHGAKVLNNSWGGGGYSPLLKDAVDYALANNVVVVASAGNDYSDLHNGIEAFPGVISVGASTNTDTKTNFSNIGPRVDLFAPGTDGLTTYGSTNNGYGLFGGTSMAGPVVAGGAALVLERAAALGVTLTPYQVKKILVNSTDPMKDQPQGRLNLQKALAFSKDTLPQDGGYLAVRVTSLIDRFGLPGVDVTLVPQDGQNKGLPYLTKTGAGLLDNQGIAVFAGVEPGRYQVNVGGPDLFGIGGQRTTLTGNITVASGVEKAVMLNYTMSADLYEYVQGGYARNNTFTYATNTSGAPQEWLEKGVVVGGTFDNENYRPVVPTKGADVDIYSAVINAGDTFQFAALASNLGSQAFAQIEIYNSQQEQVATGVQMGMADSAVVYTAPSSGLYYLKVSNQKNTEGAKSYYALQLRKIPVVSSK
ncbi:S8 family peptidase [Deinococcus cellulosilyticus]|uniref:Serine protease n=1 Tax=Deinococcus cellulosilyticus (strain DSM 18568 / NBRC 106333 / KACC 11606 / 5516J-15) TaxID=1223518 RepID=A0A511N753_DEIC1|nr:S8 family serine peptidase [Deinococcus cellulosilyticus]GEM48251.1 serine protease [Deinococcus cellulosilyticus NBRC 106333 = KACC 11606]